MLGYKVPVVKSNGKVYIKRNQDFTGSDFVCFTIQEHARTDAPLGKIESQYCQVSCFCQ